ncbi:MAG: polysaccharide deacetylase family protein [Actinobacteria bacterium]|nr:polysaccharide deacetylase family protein [Actinomycetota bacterium]
MTDTHFYRSRSRERRRRARRRLLLIAALVAAAVLVVAAAGPWFGHLGLPWPGGGVAAGGVAEGGVAAGGVNAAGVSVSGADDAWHNAPVELRFKTLEGDPTAAEWRVDGGAWHKSPKARVAAPMSHGNDGEHVVEVRAVGGGQVVGYAVRIDTTPPSIADVSVSPARISAARTLKLGFDVPAGAAAVMVDWAVLDTLGEAVGKRGAPHPAAGPETVGWAARSASGGALFPGTYRLQVTARDAAGNEATATASLACDAPVRAKLITNLPKAGKLVALTFDGGSGYAWRHIMTALTKLNARGTFFCTGVSVDKYPEVAREAIAQGMVIGNHSYDHPNFQVFGYDAARRQLLRNAEAWWKACGATPTPFFRPPYGSYNDTTLKAAGSAGYVFVVNWDVDTGDWSGAPAAKIARRAIEGARPGSIICMHTEWTTQAAIPAMVKGLRAKGLEPVGLDELFRAAGLL